MKLATVRFAVLWQNRPIKHQTRLKYPHLWPCWISGFFLMFCELTFTNCICLLYSIKTLLYKLLNLISPNLKLTPASTGPCFRHCEPVFMVSKSMVFGSNTTLFVQKPGYHIRKVSFWFNKKSFSIGKERLRFNKVSFAIVKDAFVSYQSITRAQAGAALHLLWLIMMVRLISYAFWVKPMLFESKPCF